MIKLSPRLKMAADMVRSGSRLADIGTDHAYLPASLILNGTIPYSIAADLRKGPLENASATVRLYSIADKMQLRLSDGLQAVMPGEVDDIVIAGMGGILISEILEAADWIKNSSLRLILQPQSHDEDVRKFLWNNGFRIVEEKACIDDSKPYICFCAEYDASSSYHTDTELFFGNYYKIKNEASLAFVNKKLKRVNARLKALKESGINSEEITLLSGILKEVSQWQK